jgi:hypothetical protein
MPVIPATPEVETWRIVWFKASLDKKLVRPHLKKTSQAWWSLAVTSTT